METQRQAPGARAAPSAIPTIWGLSPIQVHDRFWAARGVQVVRRGVTVDLDDSAELFLLVDPHCLAVFRLRDLVEVLSWLRPRLMVVRVRDGGHDDYREVVRTTEDGRLVGFDRIYEGLDSRLARIGLTPHRDVARIWQEATGSSTDAWRRLRRAIPREARIPRSMPGKLFHVDRHDQVMAYLECVMEAWARPDSTIPRARRDSRGSWHDREGRIEEGASVIGRIWVGAGRTVSKEDMVVGPAILWDDPKFKPSAEAVPWEELEPVAMRGRSPQRPVVVRRPPPGKRIFDLIFSLVALALTLPLYPFIILAILIEDGWPVFFTHRRETRGGREFPCLKFRSMRKDAEMIKAQLMTHNVSDGPQFFVKKDPRSTRVGRFLRATQLDEIPQFLNVLLGHMSIVGPRPSPRRENQFCPSWREERLSVRPGVTGLWQIRRTRAEGLDFQEWIRFDLEYVERMSWGLDLWILWRTIAVVLRIGSSK
jgi:lipopolysaccharide/colanic/teichoic acid biosynthesis glycosyltransferase